MPFNLGVTELVIILAIILIIFGPGKLPSIGKALGDSIKSFRNASKGEQEGAPKEENKDSK